MLILIDLERERLHRMASQWGFNDRRTIRQSQKIDRMIYRFMRHALTQNKERIMQ